MDVFYLARCPVLVRRGDDESGSPRCDEPILPIRYTSREDGRFLVFPAECAMGHGYGEIAHDLNLDLDGVPINA